MTQFHAVGDVVGDVDGDVVGDVVGDVDDELHLATRLDRFKLQLLRNRRCRSTSLCDDWKLVRRYRLRGQVGRQVWEVARQVRR